VIFVSNDGWLCCTVQARIHTTLPCRCNRFPIWAFYNKSRSKPFRKKRMRVLGRVTSTMVIWLKDWILKYGYRSPNHPGEYRLNRVSLRNLLHKLYWKEVGRLVDPKKRPAPTRATRDYFVKVFKKYNYARTSFAFFALAHSTRRLCLCKSVYVCIVAYTVACYLSHRRRSATAWN
jgi:hypothetical protein